VEVAVSVPLHHVGSGTGPPLLLLHAFPLDHRMWSAQQRELSGSCRVITVDLRGFGASPLGDEPPDLDAMADDVALLLDTLGVARAAVAGLSMGGYVAMALIRRRPDLVRAVALIDTKAGADSPDARQVRERIADEALASGSLDGLLRDVVPGLTGPTTRATRPAIVDDVARMAASAAPEAVAWAQRAMAQRPDSFSTLASFTGPALVVVGDEDAVSPPYEADAMVGALSRARLVTIAGSGHLTAMEQPRALTDALQAWVTEAEDGA
jgi:pimeloyl-ACP methyl ester carboxylesterase